MAVERGEVEILELKNDTSCTAPAASPSCYRVAALSGSLEVSARLKNADDLELLLKVLEANRGLFPKVERSAAETVMKATNPSDQAETNGFAKKDKESEAKARVDRLANGILTP